MIPEQLNDRVQLEHMYEQLVKRIGHRKVSHFFYAEHSDGHIPVTAVAGELTFHPLVESKSVDRVGKIAGIVSSVSLRNNGVRSKLYINLDQGPLLVVEQGARFEFR